MRLPEALTTRLRIWAARVIATRAPDFTIGAADRPYLKRWYIVPRNRCCNIYLHQMLRDDDARALHDHPWWWCSIILAGGYREHTIDAGGIGHIRRHRAGSLRIRSPRLAHRLSLGQSRTAPNHKRRVCVTLFITGPRVRQWGFHCANGWRHWKRFTRRRADGSSAGCE